MSFTRRDSCQTHSIIVIMPAPLRLKSEGKGHSINLHVERRGKSAYDFKYLEYCININAMVSFGFKRILKTCTLSSGSPHFWLFKQKPGVALYSYRSYLITIHVSMWIQKFIYANREKKKETKSVPPVESHHVLCQKQAKKQFIPQNMLKSLWTFSEEIYSEHLFVRKPDHGVQVQSYKCLGLGYAHMIPKKMVARLLSRPHTVHNVLLDSPHRCC